jgi:hypothetical protein
VKGLKPTLVSAIAIGLLAGSAVGVAAQDEAAMPELRADTVSGTMTSESGTQSDGDTIDGLRQDLQEERGHLEMSDPRLTGAFLIAATMNRYQPVGDEGAAEVFSGTMRVDNDGGSWEGTAIGCSGCNTTDGPDTTYVELAGTAEHEGLSAILFIEQMPGFNQPAVSYGVIFPGEVPSP